MHFYPTQCLILGTQLGLPLTSTFLLEYSSEYLNEFSLIPEATNDE